MYLKRLELQGFKSFADKTVLEFMPGITTVIGPNGSGKSNISDAIRWVLGEQSMKSLRGAKSEDIIFAGTQNRKSLGFAEASIIFDNSDGKLPVEYTEVTVTRKIYRSGESNYFINKVPCRLKDILELFMDTGIGKDGYSIIGQGKIDEILSNKSEDRRKIFEEAAGIVKYRTRKVESEKKLEQTKLNLLRINDILQEIEQNIGPLKIQSEKAKKFLSLREELKSIEVGLFLHNIEEYKQKLVKVIEDEEIFKTQEEAENSKMSEINELKEELKRKIDEITNEIEHMQNIGFESEKEIEKINSEIQVLEQRIVNNIENTERYNNEIVELETRNSELEEEKKIKEEKKSNLFSNKEKFEKELEEKENELKKLTESLSEKELEIENKKKKQEEYTDKKYEIISSIKAMEANFENIEKRKKTLLNEKQNTISELDSTRITKEEIAKDFYEIDSKKNKVTQDLEKISSKKQETESKLKQFEDEIVRLTSESRMKESRYKFLVETEKEKEGYTKSVKLLLQDCEKDNNLSKGMNGILANLIDVKKEYQTAIEQALGGVLQNIVTETETEAKKLVEHLRVNNLGRASFLPISSVKGRKLEKIDTRKVEGIIGIASDLVKTDKRYEDIIISLLGRTVIVDDMQNAIALAKQNKYAFRIVTLKGDVINPSGAITGGSVMKKTVNILGRTGEIKELEQELQSINKKIEKLNKDKEEYEKATEDTLEEVASLENSLQEIDIVYATNKQKLIAVEENIARLEGRLEKIKKEIENLEQEKEKMNVQKEEATKEIEELQNEVEILVKEITEYAELNKDNQKYIDDLNFDVTNLKISVSSFNESQDSIEEMVARINLDIENNNLSIENKKIEIGNLAKENEEKKINIESLKAKIEETKAKVGTSSTEIENLKAKRIETNEKLSETEKKITEEFEQIEELKAQIVKIDVKKTKLQEDIENVINKLWEEYEITPNNAGEYEKPENVAQTTKKVHDLRNSIKNLGSVNVDAIEEYKELSKRYDFLCEQRLDLEETTAKLRKVINEMTTTMKEQFSQRFKIINKNFGEVFAELFGGGKAELSLADEENILECGIDINVQPPGKKLQSMTLLSGGEKAFTAIALLFAILKVNPSPFCVLDEIEAALDDVNVYRYADYLKKFAKDTQFLVITHRKGTMEAADTVYGITMEENGISKLLSMKLK